MKKVRHNKVNIPHAIRTFNRDVANLPDIGPSGFGMILFILGVALTIWSGGNMWPITIFMMWPFASNFVKNF